MSDRVTQPTAGRAPVGGVLKDALVMRISLILLILYLLITLALPLYALLSKSVEDREQNFVGLANFARFMEEPGLSSSVWNSFFVSIVSTTITILLAFAYAYGLQRSTIPFKGMFRAIAMMPLLAPSLMPGIALVYLFGKQGIFKEALFGHSIYGPIGIIIGEVLFSFPHALLIIGTALSVSDQRLYDSARVLRAGTMRTFLTVTLPGCRYGIISAFFAVFTLVFTDFGVPSTIGGSYPVLATEVYKQVVGRFDFEMGAVVGILLLFPAVVSFIADQIVKRRQVSMMTSAATPLALRRHILRDSSFLTVCALCAGMMLLVYGMAVMGSLFKLWPYNLSLTLKHYDFKSVDGTGWYVYFNSLKLGFLTATIGTVVIFLGAYFIEKTRGAERLRGFAQFLCMMPLAVPGMVLGVSYIFFFNDPANPLNSIYGTMVILLLSTITHFYTVPHLAAMTALKQVDPDFEAVGQSLKGGFHVVLRRVTLPICQPVILNIWTYLFVNAMTTVSAVVFLYTAQTKLAAITIVHWVDGGKLPSAAALSVVVFASSALVWLLQSVITRGMLRRSQAWQGRHHR